MNSHVADGVSVAVIGMSGEPERPLFTADRYSPNITILLTRCKAKPDCGPPGYRSNRLLIIANWFACVHRFR